MLIRTQVKVCGITRRSDAEAAAAAGVDFLGVVCAPGGPRMVPVPGILPLVDDLRPRRVGVFVNASTLAMTEAATAARLHVLQLHGDEPPEQLRELREHGDWTLWKAVRPRTAGEFLTALERYSAVADGILLDAWSATARGGTGERFPWEPVAEHRHQVPAGMALIVAGGMRAENVGEAVALLRPDVVDISSGVERAPGVKDPEAIRAFLITVHSLPAYPSRL